MSSINRKNNLTEEELQQLKAMHDMGFALLTMLKSMPDHISILYEPYYKQRGTRKYTKYIVSKFISVTKAIYNDTDTEVWRSYWNRVGIK